MQSDLFYELVDHLVFDYLFLLDLFYGGDEPAEVVPGQEDLTKLAFSQRTTELKLVRDAGFLCLFSVGD